MATIPVMIYPPKVGLTFINQINVAERRGGSIKDSKLTTESKS